MKAKVISPFTMGNGFYDIDAVVDLPAERVQRLVMERLVVAIEEPAPIVTEKAEAHKKSKGGRKMRFKKLMGALVVLGALAASAHAGNIRIYEMTVTTNTPTGSATLFTNGGFPNISGGAWLNGLLISSAAVSGGQTVTVYDTCTSSSAATAKWSMFISATPSAGTYITFPRWSYKMTNPCVAVNGASSALKATFFYE